MYRVFSCCWILTVTKHMRFVSPQNLVEAAGRRGFKTFVSLLNTTALTNVLSGAGEEQHELETFIVGIYYTCLISKYSIKHTL